MLVEGINVVRELLESNSRVEKIIAEKSNNPEIVKILDKANAVRVPIEIVEKQDLERIAKGKTQGVVAFVPNFRYVELEDILLVSKSKNKPAFIVVLDGVVDPHNVGAIIRTCECAGVDGVIIPENRACDINSTVYKTSAGAITHVKVAQVTNLTRTIEKLKENGIWCYALEAGEKTIYDADFKYSTALIVGSEGKGVSRLVKETCDEVVSLDMFGEVNSLNASNAAAIAVYEVVRQRRS